MGNSTSGPFVTNTNAMNVTVLLLHLEFYTFGSRPASWFGGQESLTTNHEVPGSIPGSTVGIFPEGEDSRGDHGLGRSV